MTAEPAPVTVFDGDLLRARLWRPDGPTQTLYVTFRQWQPEPGGFSDRGTAQRALQKGMAHLHLQTRWNDWFLNAETSALEAALAATTAGFSEVRAIGFSMGGYAALRLSAALSLRQVLLISPQVSLDAAVIPEDRYPEALGFDPVAGDLARCVRPGLTGVVAFDPFYRQDRLHAQAIMALVPGIAPARLGFAGHPASAVIGGAGDFRLLQRLGLGAPLRAADVVRLHRERRATSLPYWRQRAETCLRRGRLAAAASAIERGEALLPPGEG